MKIHDLNLGDAVTIVAPGPTSFTERTGETKKYVSFLRAFVWSRGENLLVLVNKKDAEKSKPAVFETRKWDDEGRTWCRGWSGPTVDALKTVNALLESTT